MSFLLGNIKGGLVLGLLCGSLLPKPAQLYCSSVGNGKDESHLLIEAKGVHKSHSDISLSSFELLKLRRRMEQKNIRNLFVSLNFSGKLARLHGDRKKDQKGRPRRSPAGGSCPFPGQELADPFFSFWN